MPPMRSLCTLIALLLSAAAAQAGEVVGVVPQDSGVDRAPARHLRGRRRCRLGQRSRRHGAAHGRWRRALAGIQGAGCGRAGFPRCRGLRRRHRGSAEHRPGRSLARLSHRGRRQELAAGAAEPRSARVLRLHGVRGRARLDAGRSGRRALPGAWHRRWRPQLEAAGRPACRCRASRVRGKRHLHRAHALGEQLCGRRRWRGARVVPDGDSGQRAWWATDSGTPSRVPAGGHLFAAASGRATCLLVGGRLRA